MTQTPPPTPAASRSRGRGLAAALALPLALALALSGCAPEPGTPGADADGTGAIPEKTTGPVEGESSWSTPPPEPEKSQALPEGFPSAEVPLPADAVVDDAGAGAAGEGAWFAVLRFADSAAAEAALDTLIAEGGFSVTADERPLPGERSAELETASTRVEALVLPAPDGTGSLLSLSVSQG